VSATASTKSRNPERAVACLRLPHRVSIVILRFCDFRTD
jgi:hypothetical protein